MNRRSKGIWIIGLLIFFAVALFFALSQHSVVKEHSESKIANEDQKEELNAIESPIRCTDEPTNQPVAMHDQKRDSTITAESKKESPMPSKRPLTTRKITNPPTETPTAISPTHTPNPWKDTVVNPTCEEAGYIVRENTIDGVTTILKGEAALGHDWSEWKKNSETGQMISTCTRCGKEMSRAEIYTGTIPRIDFFGGMEGIGKADRVTLKLDFSGPDEFFSCYAYTTWQGHSSLMYPKKNFTIRLYDDEQITKKHNVIFHNWQREHKYVLKANYHDVTQIRNLLAADIWAEMVASRSNLYEPLRQTSHFGAVDGFPVIVYMNNDFLGLYTMNLHKDDDLYQMKNAYDTVMVANATYPDETRFYANAAFTDEKNAWEVEFCGTGEDTKWAQDKLNELISFVMKASDKEFREHLKAFLDVDAAIDYLIFLYVTGLKENASKDLVLLKYHDCNAWIPTVYDMEHAFGLGLDGKDYIPAKVFLPEKNAESWNSNTSSLLWDRVLQLFEKEIRDRYTMLRKTILTEDKLVTLIDSYQVPAEYYQLDMERWERTIPNGNPIEQLHHYFTSRIDELDSIFDEVSILKNKKGRNAE